MGKLTTMVSQAIIDGLKGKVDFYYYFDIPCFRKWPRKPDLPRTPAVQAQWPAFAYASKMWLFLDKEVQDAYKRMSAGTTMSGRDIFIKSFINGNFIKLE